MSETFLGGRVALHPGDSREVLKGIPDGSIDSCVTDPPYALVSIGKRFGAAGAKPAQPGASGAYARAAAGFMGQTWDTGETAFDPAFWAEVWRVLKPGAHLVAFGGTRSYHRLACAIEDAGFEIRDQLAWVYGSGFPKSHNQKGDWAGWGTALKPAWEPIVLARKPLAGTVAETVVQHGTGALNIDGCRVHADDAQGGAYTIKRFKPGATLNETGGTWKPEGDGPVYEGMMKPGRWPANIVHDGSDEVVSAFPQSAGQQGDVRGTEASQPFGGHVYGEMTGRHAAAKRGDTGSAARFFYSAKADAHDRAGSKHPTVKPVDLMQWLCRLVTPPGGTVLDPFAGSGSTAEAAWREGFSAVLIEREAAYREDIARRLRLAEAGPATRKAESAKARAKEADLGPLFGDAGLAGGGRRVYGHFADQDGRSGRSD